MPLDVPASYAMAMLVIIIIVVRIIISSIITSNNGVAPMRSSAQLCTALRSRRPGAKCGVSGPPASGFNAFECKGRK